MKNVYALLVATWVIGCSDSVPKVTAPTKDQCPSGTYPDNSGAGEQSVSVTGNADLVKQAGGVSVTTAGKGAAHFTCRQMCANGTQPNYEDSESPSAGKMFKFHCDAVGGKPATDYIEVEKDGKRSGTVTSPDHK